MHICVIPHFATFRAINVRYHKKTSTTSFCDTIATSIARYEKYRCWTSKHGFPNAVMDICKIVCSKHLYCTGWPDMCMERAWACWSLCVQRSWSVILVAWCVNGWPAVMVCGRAEISQRAKFEVLLKMSISLGRLDWKSGYPKTRNPTTTDPTPPSRRSGKFQGQPSQNGEFFFFYLLSENCPLSFSRAKLNQLQTEAN